MASERAGSFRRRLAIISVVAAVAALAAAVGLLAPRVLPREPAMRVVLSTVEERDDEGLDCIVTAALFVASTQDTNGLPTRSTDHDMGVGFRERDVQADVVFNDPRGCETGEAVLALGGWPSEPPPYLVIVEAENGYGRYAYVDQQLDPAGRDEPIVISLSLADFDFPALEQRPIREGQPCRPGQLLPTGYVCRPG